MKIRVYCGVGLIEGREAIIDTWEDWGITDADWEDLLEGDREELVLDWANNYFEYGYRELDD